MIQTTTGKTDKWLHLRTSLYFSVDELVGVLATPASRKQVIRYFAGLGVTKAYFECASFRHEVENQVAREIASDFAAAGYTVAGALQPTMLCYNNKEHMANLARRVRNLAGMFDEIIVDDWLFTVCNCGVCLKKRGTRSWSQYRRELLTRQSQKQILAVARKTNPKVSVTVKFPNWAECHYVNGYDIEARIAQFDRFCVGVETRSLTGNPQHIPSYSAYVFQRWYTRIDPSKCDSCWFDNWDMKNHVGEYLAQAINGVMGGARELIVWSGGRHYRGAPWARTYKPLEKLMPRLDGLTGLLTGRPKGLDMYLPPGGEGEYNLYGYLGMIGLPLNPVTEFPKGGGTVLLDLHAAKDPALVDRILKRLSGGGNVMLTWELVKKLERTEVGNFFPADRVSGGPTTSGKVFGIDRWWPGAKRIFESECEIVFPKMPHTTWPETRLVNLMREDRDCGVLLRNKYLAGFAYMLNVPDNQADLFRLPVPVLNRIRMVFLSELGMTFEGDSRVSIYPYDDGNVVVCNLNPKKVTGCLRFPADVKDPGRWREWLDNRKVGTVSASDHDGPGIRFELKPFDLILLSKER